MELSEHQAANEASCAAGGNYGLCRTHPTCELIRARLHALQACCERLEAGWRADRATRRPDYQIIMQSKGMTISDPATVFDAETDRRIQAAKEGT